MCRSWNRIKEIMLPEESTKLEMLDKALVLLKGR